MALGYVHEKGMGDIMRPRTKKALRFIAQTAVFVGLAFLMDWLWNAVDSIFVKIVAAILVGSPLFFLTWSIFDDTRNFCRGPWAKLRMLVKRGKEPGVTDPDMPTKARKPRVRAPAAPETADLGDEPKTTGQLLKDVGITRGKTTGITKQPAFTPVKRIISEVCEPEDPRSQIRAKWQPLIKRLEDGERIFIGRNDHYGSARGTDILLCARRDLKRLGYNCKIKKNGYDGEIWLEKSPQLK